MYNKAHQFSEFSRVSSDKCSEARLDLCFVMILPVSENNLSHGTKVAGTHKYDNANSFRAVNDEFFQYSRGFTERSSTGSSKYC